MNRIASLFATAALVVGALLVSSPAEATVGTDSLTCTSPSVTQVYIDGHGPWTKVSGTCTEGLAGTTYRIRVRFVTVFGGGYWKTSGWTNYGSPLSVTSDRLLDSVMSVTYQWGDVVAPTSKSRVPVRHAPIVAR